ncbi:hypothetical protein [Leifsonia sp. NPDC058230]|uniref:hypothetical protein n=1 Tax=Leifsonia sp. NPDC058230 TaxID=3346391 RepID=UPI0036D9A02E
MNDVDPTPEQAKSARPPLLIALAVILMLEALLVTGAAVWLLVELLTVVPESYASAIAIFVLVALTAVWIAATAIAALQCRGWSRASAVTIQVLQIAVAVGSFQGFYARPDLGWALLVPALAGIVLALTPQVVRATTRNTTQHE